MKLEIFSMYLSQSQDNPVSNLLPGVSAFQMCFQRLLPQFFHATSTLRKITCKSRLFTLWSSLLFLYSYSTSADHLSQGAVCNETSSVLASAWLLKSGWASRWTLTLRTRITKATGNGLQEISTGAHSGFCLPLTGIIPKVRALRAALWCQSSIKHDQCSQREWTLWACGNNFSSLLCITEQPKGGETPQRRKEPEFQTFTARPPTSELNDLENFDFLKLVFTSVALHCSKYSGQLFPRYLHMAFYHPH